MKAVPLVKRLVGRPRRMPAADLLQDSLGWGCFWQHWWCLWRLCE